jgi:hypothetical protein
MDLPVRGLRRGIATRQRQVCDPHRRRPISKAAHFIPLAHLYNVTTVARAFFDSIVRLHGIPSSIVSNRDPVCTSRFWSELLSTAGVKLNLSSAFHPQSDGQSEVVNKIIMRVFVHTSLEP